MAERTGDLGGLVAIAQEAAATASQGNDDDGSGGPKQ